MQRSSFHTGGEGESSAGASWALAHPAPRRSSASSTPQSTCPVLNGRTLAGCVHGAKSTRMDRAAHRDGPALGSWRMDEQVSEDAADRIGDVIVAVGRMVDAVLPAARRAALQAAQLGDEPGVVEQRDRARVERGQGVAVEVRLRLLRRPCR